MRALDEHRSQGLVPGPSASGPALAGTLVVAGTEAAPGCEAAGGAEHLHLGSGLDQDGAGRHVVDTGDRLEQTTLFRVRRQGVGDVAVELVHAPGKRVVFVQQVGEQHAIGFAQLQTQRIAELVDLEACPLSDARMPSRSRPPIRPSRTRRPLAPKTSLSTAPMRTPLRSRTFCIRLRTRLRCATSERRWRLTDCKSRNYWEGMKLGRSNPN